MLYEASVGYKKILNHGEGYVWNKNCNFIQFKKKLSLNEFKRINQNILNLNFNLKLNKFLN